VLIEGTDRRILMFTNCRPFFSPPSAQGYVYDAPWFVNTTHSLPLPRGSLHGRITQHATQPFRSTSRSEVFRSPDRPSRSELLYRMSYRGPPTVTSIVLKYRETADILTLPFGVVVSGNKTVIQQLAGKQQLLRHITLVAATHEPALEWSLMLVRAAD